MTAEEALRLAQVRWEGAASATAAWWGRGDAIEAWHVHTHDGRWLGNVEAFGDQGTWVLTAAANAPERWSPSITVTLDEMTCGWRGDPVCSPPDCSGACPSTGTDTRPVRR